MHTVQNARITLLATALNNLALSIVVAGFIAPAATGQLHGAGQVAATLAWTIGGVISTLLRASRAQRTSHMTWDQVLTWIVIPLVGSIAIGAGALWASRRIP